MEEQSDSNSAVMFWTVQFYGNNHNSQSNHWIELKFDQDFTDILFYIALKFQVNQSSKQQHNTDQKLLYRFCYLVPFDL